LIYQSYKYIKVSNHHDKFIFRIARSHDASGAPFGVSTAATVTEAQESPRCIWLPSKEVALALFRDYIDNSNCFLHIIHEPSIRALIVDVYDRLSCSKSVRCGSVALIFSIIATSGCFWGTSFSSSCAFESRDDAANKSRAWQQAAWDLMDQSQRVSSGALEDVQARMILADLLYNMEGCSSRFIYLQHSALAVARGISLHVIDAEGHGWEEDAPTREVKRRAWWYLASTDW
jgi:Fungal specific transcription factor domain